MLAMELEDVKGVKMSMGQSGNSPLIGIEELAYFSTILNYSEILNQEQLEKTRNERLDRIEQKLDYLISQLENENE